MFLPERTGSIHCGAVDGRLCRRHDRMRHSLVPVVARHARAQPQGRMAGDGVRALECDSMQREARRRAMVGWLSAAIQRVPYDRKAVKREHGADLVLEAAAWARNHERHAALRGKHVPAQERRP